jgi:hypothetical protein
MLYRPMTSIAFWTSYHYPKKIVQNVTDTYFWVWSQDSF